MDCLIIPPVNPMNLETIADKTFADKYKTAKFAKFFLPSKVSRYTVVATSPATNSFPIHHFTQCALLKSWEEPGGEANLIYNHSTINLIRLHACDYNRIEN